VGGGRGGGGRERERERAARTSKGCCVMWWWQWHQCQIDERAAAEPPCAVGRGGRFHGDGGLSLDFCPLHTNHEFISSVATVTQRGPRQALERVA
jgi:hypothetical protein